MLRLSDFVAGRNIFYNLSRELCISATKHCRIGKLKFRTHIIRTLHVGRENLLILSRLSDFVTFGERF